MWKLRTAAFILALATVFSVFADSKISFADFDAANQVLINKSGKEIPIYQNESSSSQRIGTIKRNEVFSVAAGEGWLLVVFLDKYGNISNGFIDSYQAYDLARITDYPYAYKTINGVTYKTFKFRRTEKIYCADGSLWGKVASGCQVACLNETCGSTHREWKKINYVLSSARKWVKVSGNGSDYGFVNMGYEKGTSRNTISMYGSW